jgi:nucleoid-associated protein YgaU
MDMKSKHIVVLGLAFLWALTSCVFEDELLRQDTPPAGAVGAVAEQDAADAAATALDNLDAASDALAESGDASSDALDESDSARAESPSSPAAAAVGATLPGQYMVQSGDTLSGIAARAGIYWNSSLWISIYNANRDKVTLPDVILPDVILIIPPLRGEIREGEWEAGVDYENPFTGR